MHRELLLSIGRKLLIAALLVSASLLLLRTDYFSASGRRLPAPGEAAVSADSAASASAEAAVALHPRAVLVRTPDGTASASAYDGETTELSFRRFSALLGEALGSAGAPAGIPETEFRSGLESGSVFVDLGIPYPLDLLSDWLGTGAGGVAERSADLLYLGLSGDEVLLCFRDGAGDFWRCATAARADTLAARMGDFQAADAYFAYESELLREAEAYTVILEELPPLYTARGSSARDYAEPEELMKAMGMNSYLTSSYYDADGTQVLMEDGRTLRLGPDGSLAYRNAGNEPGDVGDGLVAAVNRACRLVIRSAGISCGDAEIMFSGVDAGMGAYTVYFDYCVNGVPVLLKGGHAATVTIGGGIVRGATLDLRRYTVTEERELAQPMLMTAAIAAAEGGGAPALAYMDSGDRTQCVWVSG